MGILERLRRWWSRPHSHRKMSGRDTVLTCPYCGGTKWLEGPRGGMSTNIMCANAACEHWFNYHQGFIPMDDLHRIGRRERPR